MLYCVFVDGVVIVVLLLFVFGWRIRKINDAYSIKRELKYLALAIIPFVMLSIVSLVVASGSETANIIVELLIWVVSTIAMPGILTFYPVWLSYYHRYGSLPRRRRMSRTPTVSRVLSDTRLDGVKLFQLLTYDEFKVVSII